MASSFYCRISSCRTSYGGLIQLIPLAPLVRYTHEQSGSQEMSKSITQTYSSMHLR
nr:MAG TPA: hypothetical protein [Caudoviricetes sp.]DAL72022.1 MAG TPA: hypothetical protein [Caudoviricetes sp.]